ncbi:Cleavage and polyadenylation specificity factor subunit [Sesamum alatum]|uniref:Cleavage and polyadenylation specificity factor subunit n=1 Tax=Sesamum alatum TaxID=300844 RepID=A0AAE2CG35_9LAMI|nr:Cleavage and polyadenylation specificity factor subunit [Sesamum alatum]
MDGSEAGCGDYGRDPSEQFHRKEAISAVVEEGFIGEEEDDYEDLYNDVNVGENFLQSMRKKEDELGRRSEEVPENKPAVVTPRGPVVENRSIALQGEGASSRVPGGVEGYQNVGYRGNNDANDIGVGRGTGAPLGGAGLRIELGPSPNKLAELDERIVRNSVPSNQQMVQHQQPHAVIMGSHDNVGNMGNMNGTGGSVHGGGDVGGGGTTLFVGDLHWWTTDAELEAELCKYGPVKEVKFFEERASGKSKGYCQVEFYDPAAATACKEGMNGHIFNGRPCVVAYASPYTVKKMGEAQVNRNQQQMGQTANQPRKGPGDLASKPGGVGSSIPSGGNHHSGGDNNGRGFGRGNWGRGNSQGGMGNRGPIGAMRGRTGGMGFRGLAGNCSGFGQGIGGVPPLLHPQAMMGQGFDPAFGGPMGRMGSYGGFPGAPTPHFPGMLPSFGHVGNVGLPGVAPHVNPAFFGRGMPLNGMGMMATPGVEGPNMGMWSDPNMGGWAGEEHGGRAGESSYGEEAASDHQFGEGSQERGPRPNAMKEKDRGSERDWSSSSERRFRDDREAAYDRDLPREKDMGRDHDRSERRHRDDRDVGRDREKDRNRDRDRSLDQDRGRERERERHRDDRDRHADHQRYRNREAEYDDKSSRTHNKSRSSHEEEQRSRKRDADSGKKRRVTSD